MPFVLDKNLDLRRASLRVIESMYNGYEKSYVLAQVVRLESIQIRRALSSHIAGLEEELTAYVKERLNAKGSRPQTARTAGSVIVQSGEEKFDGETKVHTHGISEVAGEISSTSEDMARKSPPKALKPDTSESFDTHFAPPPRTAWVSSRAHASLQS